MWWKSKHKRSREDERSIELVNEIRGLRSDLQGVRRAIEDETSVSKDLVSKVEAANSIWRSGLVQVVAGLFILLSGTIATTAAVRNIVRGVDWTSATAFITVLQIVAATFAAYTLFLWFGPRRKSIPWNQLDTEMVIVFMVAAFTVLVPIAIWLPTWVQGTAWENRLGTLTRGGSIVGALAMLAIYSLVPIRRLRGRKPLPPARYWKWLTWREELIVFAIIEIVTLCGLADPTFGVLQP